MPPPNSAELKYSKTPAAFVQSKEWNSKGPWAVQAWRIRIGLKIRIGPPRRLETSKPWSARIAQNPPLRTRLAAG